MEDNSGWFKPFIAALIVLGLALLVGWFIAQSYINSFQQKINDVTRYVNGLVGPMLSYFTALYRYSTERSDELLEQVRKATDTLTEAITTLSDPTVSAKLNRYLQEKFRLGYESGKEAEQMALNEKIAEAIGKNPDRQAAVKRSLDAIDTLFFQSLGDPNLLRQRVSDFAFSFLEALMN